jgi:hypothetical protein
MNLRPTKEGKIVDARLLVKIGVLFFKASPRLGKAVKKGPVGCPIMRRLVVARGYKVTNRLAFPCGPAEESGWGKHGRAVMSTERGQGTDLKLQAELGEHGSEWVRTMVVWIETRRVDKVECLDALSLSPSEPKGGDHVIEHALGPGSVNHPLPLLTSL